MARFGPIRGEVSGGLVNSIAEAASELAVWRRHASCLEYLRSTGLSSEILPSTSCRGEHGVYGPAVLQLALPQSTSAHPL